MNDKRFLTKQIEKELKFMQVGLGAKHPQVRKVQEWLNHAGFMIVVDGHWGPATNRALNSFCLQRHLVFDDLLTTSIWSALIKPLSYAIKYQYENFNISFSGWVRLIAEHWTEARELGGNNKGPWVRIFMKGNEGKDWPWCAGFVGTILEQASQFSGIPSPVTPSFSTSAMAREAKRTGRIRSMESNRPETNETYIFLLRGGRTGWRHTGFTYDMINDTVDTIEGNTNLGGSTDGDRIHRRIRASSKSDFIFLN